MTYLAFDPDLLRAARHRLAGLPEWLARLRCADALADDANRAMAALGRDLADVWLPCIDRVLATDALTAGARRRLAPTDLERALVDEITTDGRAVIDDPLECGPPILGPTEARALARLLVLDARHRFTGDADDAHLLDTDAEIAWLTEALAGIARDEVALRAFLDTFDEWDAVVAWVLEWRRGALDDLARGDGSDARERLALLDALCAALAQVLDGAPRNGAAWPHQLDAIDPMAGALLARHLQLAPLDRARLGAALVDRYWRGDAPRQGVLLERIGDAVIPSLIEHDRAAPGVLTEFIRLVDPAALYFSANDTSLITTAMVASTRTDATTATEILTRYLDNAVEHSTSYFPAPGSDFEVQAALAAMALPWVGWLAGRWRDLSWTREERDARIGVIVATGRARDVITRGRAVWVDPLIADGLVDTDGGANAAVLHDLAEALTVVMERMRTATIDNARDLVLIGDVIARLAAAVPELLTGGAAAVGGGAGGVVATDSATSASSSAATDALGRAIDAAVAWGRSRGILPPTAEMVANDAQRVWLQGTLDGKVFLVIAGLAALEGAGRLPTGVRDRVDLDDLTGCPAEAIEERLFALARAEDLSAAQRRDVALVVSSVLNVGEARLLCE